MKVRTSEDFRAAYKRLKKHDKADYENVSETFLRYVMKHMD